MATNERPLRLTLLGTLALVCLLPLAAHAYTIAWDPVTTSITGRPARVRGYTIYRSTDKGQTFRRWAADTRADLTATDAESSDDVCYEVTAHNAAGESPRSNRLCVSDDPEIPAAPTNVRRRP